MPLAYIDTPRRTFCRKDVPAGLCPSPPAALGDAGITMRGPALPPPAPSDQRLEVMMDGGFLAAAGEMPGEEAEEACAGDGTEVPV